MNRTKAATPWVRRGTWVGGVLLLGLLLSTCGSAVRGVDSGGGEGEQGEAPGNNQGETPGSQDESCAAAVGFTAIGDQAGLEAIQDDPSASYCMTQDIRLRGNWVPLGMFTGTLDGKGYTISGLMIDDTTDNGGFFRELGAGATVKDLIFNQASVKGKEKVGVLAGTSSATIENIKITDGTIELASSTGSSSNAGGLVGNNLGIIKNSYATSNVIGHNAGGLVGRNQGTIESSYASGGVSGNNIGGGLVGNNLGTIKNSHATGNASGYYYAGGLVGLHQGTIENSYAAGGASGREVAGGLVGANEGTIENSYATSNVVGATAGGLVGLHYEGTILNSYARGEVSGQTTTTLPIIPGGFVGMISGNPSITNSYFDTATTRQTKGIGQDNNGQAANVHGLTEANILYFLGVSYDAGANPRIGIFVAWDFAIWDFANQTWPTLAWQ